MSAFKPFQRRKKSISDDKWQCENVRHNPFLSCSRIAWIDWPLLHLFREPHSTSHGPDIHLHASKAQANRVQRTQFVRHFQSTWKRTCILLHHCVVEPLIHWLALRSANTVKCWNMLNGWAQVGPKATSPRPVSLFAEIYFKWNSI